MASKPIKQAYEVLEGPDDLLYWLLGGIIGMFIAMVFCLDFIFHLDMPSPELYEMFLYIAMMMLILSLLVGGSLGIVLGKITFLWRIVYREGKIAKKKH